jgi:hypothetical protein
MIAMHMGDEDASDLANSQVTTEKLMLGALAAVK